VIVKAGENMMVMTQF